jgi:hypothetical protein
MTNMQIMRHSNRSLTPDEAIKAAYLCKIMRVDQMVIAIAFGVNVGRVSEAVQAIEHTANNIRDAYHKVKASKPISLVDAPGASIDRRMA